MPFVSAAASGRLWGIQFHPEKSAEMGQRVLANFLRMVRGGDARRSRLMLARRVIPCLDVANGRVVKGTKFVNLTDEGDPADLAERYALEGADEIVFLDITAAPEGRGTMLEVVRRTASRVFVPLTVGGGVRSVDEMRDVLRAGADKVSFNTAAVATPGAAHGLRRRLRQSRRWSAPSTRGGRGAGQYRRRTGGAAGKW